MHKIFLNSMLVLSSALISPFIFAQDIAPDVELKAVTLEVIALIKQDKDIKAGDSAKLAALVETKILPHFDFTRMTQSAAARSWRLATPEQQSALTAEFRTLLVRTYSTALSNARTGERCGDIDFTDQGMRMRRHEHDAMRLVRKLDIVDESRAAGEEALILHPAHRLANAESSHASAFSTLRSAAATGA